MTRIHVDVYSPYKEMDRMVDHFSDHEKSRGPITLRSLYDYKNRDIYWHAATISGYEFKKTKIPPHIKRKLARDTAKEIVWSFETLRPVREIHIVGHEDSREASSGLLFGLSRAQIVGAVLKDKIEKREKEFREWFVIPWGAKDLRPRGNNRTAAGRAQNRYVDIIIFPRHPIGYRHYSVKIF